MLRNVERGCSIVKSACAAIRRKLAIKNSSKSLKLDPENNNTRQEFKSLEKK